MNRVALGEISANLKSGQDTRRPTKSQGFAIYEDSESTGQKSRVVGSVQNENAPHNNQPPQLPTFGGLRNAAASGKVWPEPPKVHDADFWPPPPPVPTSAESLLPFTIHEDEMPSPKKSVQAPIGSERALSRSLLNSSASSTSSQHFVENIENLVPQIPSYARTEFRQSNESILSTSPASEGFDVSAGDEEDSPMVLETTSRTVPTTVSDALFDVDEYSLHVLAHMKNVEGKYLPKWNYMTKQPDITFGMRSILVDWLVEVSEEYRLHTETLFLAVSYIDRFLSFMSVQRAKLQLVGTACMFIAAKYEEIYPPDVSEFCYITDDTYTKKQVLRMEHLILDVLGFECSPPTPHFFVNHFSKLSGCPDDSEVKFLAQYLAELTMLDAETYLHFLPSVIGAASVALSRHTLGLVAWDASMAEKTGYRVDDFKACLIYLHGTFSKAPEFPQQAIREKYKNEKYHMVSQIRPTPIF